jgi:hypothetical protein
VLSSPDEVRRCLPLCVVIHSYQVHLTIKQDVHTVVQVYAVVGYGGTCRNFAADAAGSVDRITEVWWEMRSIGIKAKAWVLLAFVTCFFQ